MILKLEIRETCGMLAKRVCSAGLTFELHGADRLKRSSMLWSTYKRRDDKC